MNVNCLEIIGLSYKNIFNNFSVAFEKEKLISISGPNNCGKTTLLKILDRTKQVDNSIVIDGKKYEEYKVTDLAKKIRSIYPLEYKFSEETVEDEIMYQVPLGIDKIERQKLVKDLAKKYKLTKYLKENPSTLDYESKIRLQIALTLINKPEIILIDDLSNYFDTKELLDLTTLLKEEVNDLKITIILITKNMKQAQIADYMYVINESDIVIEGKPNDVLEKDNILNKAGLELPFMMDLSVKLRDYDLIKEIELDMDRMVNTLWN